MCEVYTCFPKFDELYYRMFVFANLVIVVLQFRNSKTVNGAGLKLCTHVGYHDGSCSSMKIAPGNTGRCVCVLQASGNTYNYETL